MRHMVIVIIFSFISAFLLGFGIHAHKEDKPGCFALSLCAAILLVIYLVILFDG